MDATTSADLQHRLTQLLCKARRLREESDALNQEILRVSQLIAGVEPAETEQTLIEDDDFDFTVPSRLGDGADLPATGWDDRIVSSPGRRP